MAPAPERLHAVPDEAPAPQEELLTIEQLAAASGMTVRNIRSHRTNGLLPAPIVRDRVGYYGQEHLLRLRLILQLQAEGFNLRGIKRLIDQTGGRPLDLLTVRQTLTTPFETEQPRIFTAEDLIARFGPEVGPQALARAEHMKTLVPLGDGRYEAPMPSLIEMAAEVVADGVPLSHAQAVGEKVREHCSAIAREFVRLFVEDVWKPFAERGYPTEEWPTMVETIERLRPISSQAVISVYQQQMTQEVETAFGRELARMSKGR
ncbi:MAG TPA: MerR family transcriptional regulator [Solirubrobacteraceae bacterium]|jgi:DNA-binding transcriptional MerR regulator|nr:MerR family transcriptional regulator [Solirubrobacteraceae bacterium]